MIRTALAILWLFLGASICGALPADAMAKKPKPHPTTPTAVTPVPAPLPAPTTAPVDTSINHGVAPGTCWVTPLDGWTNPCPATITNGGTCNNAGTGTADGTCFVAVANAGNDTCSAFTTQAAAIAAPCLTLAHGYTLLRDGKPDWLIANKGDTFTNDVPASGSWSKSGLSQTAPMVWTSYGTGNRPRIQVNATFNSVIGDGGGTTPVSDYFAVMGLEFYAYTRDPGNVAFVPADMNHDGPAIQWESAGHWKLVEDVKISYFSQAMNRISNPDASNTRLTNLTINRNVIINQYATNTINSLGLFIAAVDNLTITGNLTDMNGWNDVIATPRTATITHASPAVVTSVGSGKYLRNDYQVTLATGGTLPSPLTTYDPNTGAGQIYCVSNLSGDTFQLYLPTANVCGGGTSINTTTDGTGTHQAINIEGWPSIFRHNYYLQSDNSDPDRQDTTLIFHGNISSRASATGCECIPGGTLTENLFLENPVAFFIGKGSPGSPLRTIQNTLTNNVVLEGVDMQTTPPVLRAFGFDGISNQVGNVNMSANVIAHQTPSSDPFGVGWRSLEGVNANGSVINVTGNAFCDWKNPLIDRTTGGILTLGTLVGGSGYANGTYTHVPLTGGSGASASANITVSGGAVTSAVITPQFYDAGNNNAATWSNGSGYSTSDTLSASNTNLGGSGSGFTIKPATLVAPINFTSPTGNSVKEADCSGFGFPDPTRTMGGYYNSLGNPGGFPSTTAGFLSAAALQSKDNWNPALTAFGANTYVRAGFGL